MPTDKEIKDSAETMRTIICLSPTSKKTIDEIIKDKLRDKDLTPAQIEILKDLRADLKDVEKCKRQKRAPSQYNIFLGKCLRGEVPEVKVSKDAPQSEKMGSCAKRWKIIK